MIAPEPIPSKRIAAQLPLFLVPPLPYILSAELGGGMPKIRLLEEKRGRLQALLSELDAGKHQHIDEGGEGELRRKTAEESRASVERRIAELSYRIAEAASHA